MKIMKLKKKMNVLFFSSDFYIIYNVQSRENIKYWCFLWENIVHELK